jgi:hypothetical protein
MDKKTRLKNPNHNKQSYSLSFQLGVTNESQIMQYKTQLKQSIIYVNWEESERGWGSRPDGCSLHLTEKDYQKYVKKYWDKMPKEAPDEYSRPVGEPTPALVTASLYEQIKDAKRRYGLRFWNHEQRELEKKKELVFKAKRSGWVPIE